MKKSKRADTAVSEVIGTALLLGMAIALFSVLNIIVFSYPFTPAPPSVNIVATIDGTNISLMHYGGEALSLDTKVILTIRSITIPRTARILLDVNTSNGDQFWNIGERLVYDYGASLRDIEVNVLVIDVKSNSVVMMGVLQG